MRLFPFALLLMVFIFSFDADSKEHTVRITATAEDKVDEPKAPPVLNELLVREGDLQDSAAEIVRELGWNSVKFHYPKMITIPQAIRLHLDGIEVPISTAAMVEIMNHVLHKSNAPDAEIKVHEEQKIVVLIKSKESKK